MSALTARGVEASYGVTPVLRGVDLDVAQGEIISVLGPSGCGKTTLLRVVAGFMAPSSGTVAIGGVAVADAGTAVPPERRRVTIVPQEGALFPHLDVSENIGFGLPRSPTRPARIAELLELIGMSDRAHAEPHHLSGGQQQRVALARALAPSPAFVLLDEPFSALDVALRAQLRTQVRTLLRHEGASALIVTHDQQEALSMADRVAVMHEGRIRQIDTPTDVYRRPVDRWVAEFVGDAVVLRADIVDGRARTALGDLPLAGVPATGQVLLRPEQITIADQGVSATVVDVDFRGHEQIVHGRLDDGTVVVVRSVGATAVPAPGTSVRLTVTGTAWGL